MRDDDWKTVNCQDPGVSHIGLNQSVRWADIYTDQAWAAAVANYTADHDGLVFSEKISHFFDASENMDCGDASGDNGCRTGTQRNDVNHPAGYFMMNSLGLVSQVCETDLSSVFNF